MRIGRSRYDSIHCAYIVPTIASEVGRIASRSVSFSLPPCVTHATSGAKPSTCSASLTSRALGNEEREIGVLVPGRLEARVELLLQILPKPEAVGAQDDATAHGRIRNQLAP